MTYHRFVHLGDLHLGPNGCNEDRIRALEQAVTEGLQLEDLAAWLWPGDLNHGRMTIEDRNVLAAALQRMAARAPVILCYGNHDLPGDLDVFGRLKAAWPIYVVSTPQVLCVPLATGPTAAIFVLPYPQRAGLVSAGTPSAGLVDAAQTALTAIFMDAAAQLQDRASRGELPLAIGHVNVGGAIASTGQPNIGREIELNPDLLARLGAIYIGLNHIHKGQEIHGAIYPGSMCRLDWGEIEPKQYLVVEYFQHSGAVWGHATKPMPLDVAPMYHVEGDLTRDGFTWRVTAGPGGESQLPPASWKGAEVRVRYTFKASERSVLSEAEIHATFANAKRLHLDPVAVPDRALRAPEVAIARTLADKVRAYAAVNGFTVTEGIAAKIARLEHAESTSVLTDVAQQLHAIEHGQTEDPTCEHGVALDVHCCNCHSGFLFDASSCTCETDAAAPIEEVV